MKEEIKIIDNYKDLLLGDYMDIVSIMNDEGIDELDKQVKVISILTGLEESYILDLPIAKYQQLAVKLNFLYGDLPQEARLAKSYRIGKFELIPVTDMRKVTTSQYIDFQSLHQAGFESHFVEILSCILIPKGKKYCQDYEILEVQNAIRTGLSVFDSASMYAFFLLSCRKSMKDMLTYSLKQVKKMRSKAREKIMKEIQEQISLLETSGDG